MTGFPNIGQSLAASDLKPIRRRIRDYAKVGLQLYAQRLLIYTAATCLAGAYYNWVIAGTFYVLVMICEVYDACVFRSIIARRKWGIDDIRSSMRKIYIGTFFSSVAIALFAISFALQQHAESGHFMPMFILVSASIFATMNNHHFLPVLAVRLTIYVAAIIFIPTYNLWTLKPPLSSELWLNFFTVLFVLGFLFELARNFLAGYSASQQSRLLLEAEHEKTKAAYIAKTQFLSTVSHELRTPLTSIKGGLDLANSGALGDIPEKMRKPLEIASRNTHRLANLVDDLLLLQRAESGKLDLSLETIDIGDLVAETVDRFQPFAKSAGVKINTDVKRNKFWVRCDARRIEQVVTNLLSNAAKFSDEQDEIYVTLEGRGNYVRILVADRGIGIAEGSHSKIFEEFGQIDSSDTRSFGGTGLGLNISKRILEAHGAKIDFTSVLGEGSTFYVEFLREDMPLS
ncbi:sensor histidine kinase [Lentibacter sp. XHP0401]|uniref:sensor histidine kinase n=1 Tax=Lentibacter sp. XHP0401 TaxID=2984334 RepID=UPI0021E7597E|nr:HAMP domain-containing sensor histidine kinase [Lentibacter sp. XHP0401]MCV2894233.1 HAMP domain-containing histidine kinase [Lentibacter sp. XHP0401]